MEIEFKEEEGNQGLLFLMLGFMNISLASVMYTTIDGVYGNISGLALAVAAVLFIFGAVRKGVDLEGGE